MRTFQIGKKVTQFYSSIIHMVSVSIDSRLVLFHNLTIQRYCDMMLESWISGVGFEVNFLGTEY
jgi:DNA-directed RNA polymerase subunit N (RpoN/RPB10)